MSVVNRKPFRAQIASELSALLVGTGKLAEALYAGQVADFGGKSPVVVISSAGSARPNDSGYVGQGATLIFAVDVLTKYSDVKRGWDELNSEDALDDIEQIIADWVLQNSARAPVAGESVAWTNLSYAGRTDAELPPLRIGGEDYRCERISLRVEIQGAL